MSVNWRWRGLARQPGSCTCGCSSSATAYQYLLLLHAFGPDQNSMTLNGTAISVTWHITSSTGGVVLFSTDSNLSLDAEGAGTFTPTGQGLPTTVAQSLATYAPTFKADLINPGQNHVLFQSNSQTYTFYIYQIEPSTVSGYKWQIVTDVKNQDAHLGNFTFTINSDGTVSVP